LSFSRAAVKGVRMLHLTIVVSMLFNAEKPY
jgi:hypothetical protein